MAADSADAEGSDEVRDASDGRRRELGERGHVAVAAPDLLLERVSLLAADVQAADADAVGAACRVGAVASSLPGVICWPPP